MVHEELSNADVNAIAKARGFSKKEKASRAVFENFLLSEIGVEEVMATLHPEEIALLHLLKVKNAIVDITFFARHYGDAGTEKKYYYGTFTQQYKPTFKKVRTKLIRKGILLFAEKEGAGDTKMDRRRFRFPPKFSAFLPPIINVEHRFEERGDRRREAVLRKKLAEILIPKKGSQDSSYALTLSDGNLMIGKRYFQTKLLQEWQLALWEAHFSITRMPNQVTLALIEAVSLIFSQLRPNEWICPSQLDTPIKMLCYGGNLPTGEKLCQAGWKEGILAKHTVDGENYYRMPLPPEPTNDDETLAPAAYLTPQEEGVKADLERIPYPQIEQLNRIMYFDIKDGNLIAKSDLIKLGWATPDVWEWPITLWLEANVPAFETVLQKVKARWGQQIVHENLYIAKIDDLSLKVQIERAFSDPSTMLSLANDFIAFPKEQLPEIKKIVSKAGYVIKTISRGD